MIRFLQTNGEFAYINASDIRSVVGLEKYYSEFMKVTHPRRTRIDFGSPNSCIIVNETPEEVYKMITESAVK